jgi:hypothetical protein
MVFAWRRSRAAVTDRRQPPRKLARRANSGHDNLKVPAGHFHESSTLEERLRLPSAPLGAGGPRPVVGAAPICTLVGDRRGAPGADLTASVDLTAFERCDRRHRSAVRQRFIFWTTHPRRRRAAKHTPPRPIAPAARGTGSRTRTHSIQR